MKRKMRRFGIKRENKKVLPDYGKFDTVIKRPCVRPYVCSSVEIKVRTSAVSCNVDCLMLSLAIKRIPSILPLLLDSYPGCLDDNVLDKW